MTTPPSPNTPGALLLARLADAARFSEGGPGVTRRFATPQHRAAADLVADWMEKAGMRAHMDDAGNMVGRYEGADPGAGTLMFGSHQDSVRRGGAYDGMLGVALPIFCIERLHRKGTRLPFAIEVVAFGDEEGVRFQTTLLGSRAIAGTFDPAVLEATDDDGVTLARALGDFGLNPENIPALARGREEILAFIEVHIEQGPVLEAEHLPVGIVTAIAGNSRLRVTIEGAAGHAGTVPMALRRDALCAAAESILAVEAICAARDGVVGTVGMIDAAPGAINVIPGAAVFSLDVRAPAAAARSRAIKAITDAIHGIARKRGVAVRIETVYAAEGCALSPKIMTALEGAIAAHGLRPHRLPSGAGHDAMAMRELTETGMLFVRCKGGVSHRPDESISAADAAAAIDVIGTFIETFDAAAFRR